MELVLLRQLRAGFDVADVHAVVECEVHIADGRIDDAACGRARIKRLSDEQIGVLFGIVAVEGESVGGVGRFSERDGPPGKCFGNLSGNGCALG